MLGVTILGNNSAIPAYNRHPTAQIVTLNNEQFLIDCGEGTQLQIAKYKIRRSKINYIFISHLHGDHYFGLIGLITSMGLLGRTAALHLFAPAPLQDIIRLQLAAADTVLPFPIHFYAHPSEGGVIYENTKCSIECFPTAHRIACWGCIIREKKLPRKLDREKAVAFEIPVSFYDKLKQGEDYITKDGQTILNAVVTIPNSPAKSYAFCADTLFLPRLATVVQQVTLLYHESTYLKNLTEMAATRYHSTAEQAAMLAKQAQVQHLLIGHFSSKYEDLAPFLEEAQTVFANTQLALEGTTFFV